MHRYTALVCWSRDGASFTDQKYSRRHTWTFDGGAVVPASSSPSIVPRPWSDPAAVDPEEALVASASSCHMLWFLSLAADKGFTVDRYEDDASGEMEADADGRLAFTRIVLRPRIAFSGDRSPDADALAVLHHDAHARCFIANSLRANVVVEPPLP